MLTDLIRFLNTDDILRIDVRDGASRVSCGHTCLAHNEETRMGATNMLKGELLRASEQSSAGLFEIRTARAVGRSWQGVQSLH